MPTIPFSEFEKLYTWEVMVYMLDYANATCVPENQAAQILGRDNYHLSNCPDWLLIHFARKKVITPATHAQFCMEPGMENISGETYEEVMSQPRPWLGNPDIGISSHGSLPGKILEEMCRRLELAMSQDKAQADILPWEPPEPWGGDGADDPPPADG